MTIDPFARIGVTTHALLRARERFGWEDDGRLEERVRVEVRQALICDRVSATRPNWTRGTLAGRQHVTTAYRFVWDVEGTRCWIVQLGDDGVTVVTGLPAAALGWDRSEARHVRKGMRRSA